MIVQLIICTRADALIHMDKVDKDMTDKDKMDKDKVEFLVLSRGPFYNCVLVQITLSSPAIYVLSKISHPILR